MDKEIQKFWDECHLINSIESLSGVEYEETVDLLKIKDLIHPGIYVLEIGVGIGCTTRGLYERGAHVSCLEVSEVGRKNSRPYCENVYGLEDLYLIPPDYFDVILCLNVVQHVQTAILRRELYHCIRSLKPTGIFAVEFVSVDGIEDAGVDPSLDTIKNGGCYRSTRFFSYLVRESGGVSSLVFDTKSNYGIHVFHIRKSINE